MRGAGPAVLGVGLFATACAGPGQLRAPAGDFATAACYDGRFELALERCAPVLLQESSAGLTQPLDRPVPLDFDRSGSLRDDRQALDHAPEAPGPFYAAATRDSTHLYLFYGLYYAADWSGSPAKPHIDHAGDFEGALLVVEIASGRVEAIVTQAHRRFFLWTSAAAPPPSAASGTFALGRGGRPLIFAEAGGHGLYAAGLGRWQAGGGRSYPLGTLAVPSQRFEPRVDSLDALRLFTNGPDGGFRDLPRGATPPWLWRDRDRRDVPAGAIVNDPARLYRALLGRGPR